MTLRKRFLRLLAIATLTPVIFLLGCQSSLIYHPRHYEQGHTDMLHAAKGERISYQSSQGRQTAFYIPPRDGNAPTAPVWLCFSGNAALALEWLPAVKTWDHRFAYFLIDYPGYGDNEGNPTPKRIRESSKAAFEALSNHLGSTPELLQGRTFVLGHSLGAAAALMAAEGLNLRQGVLISPFTSMTDMGRIVLGWPLCYLNMHRFDNRRTLAVVAALKNAQVTIFHGSNDEIIPVRMGRELAASHPGQVTFREVPHAGHNDILDAIEALVGHEMQKLAFPAPESAP